MEIVVNDTNIFIDLLSVNLLEQAFELPIGLHTVDFVINELHEDQQTKVLSFQKRDLLTVHRFTSEELLSVWQLKNSAGGNVSFTDCAAWHYAKVNGYALITGDRQLRDKAIKSSVDVHGILFLFDRMVDCGVLSNKTAAIKLSELQRINPRLPHREIKERIEKWSKS